MKDPSASTFEYRMEAHDFGTLGGIWRAPSDYSFVSRTLEQTNVELVEKFSDWEYNEGGIEQLMPAVGAASTHNHKLLSTDTGAGGWWGTILTDDEGFDPAPWMSGTTAPNADQPGIIWYWMR
jgi:hypothetical protein